MFNVGPTCVQFMCMPGALQVRYVYILRTQQVQCMTI
jgi:hypothetical protein